MLTPEGYVSEPTGTPTGRTAKPKYPEIPAPPVSDPVALGSDVDVKSLADAYIALLTSSTSAGLDDPVEVAPTLVVPAQSSGSGMPVVLVLGGLAFVAVLVWQRMGGAS